MSDGRLLGQDQISELFAELDEALQRTPGIESLELGVVGGAALVMRRGLRATFDVDFVTDDVPSDVRRLASEVAERRGIQADWLNDGAKGFTPDLPFVGMVVFEGEVLKLSLIHI